MITTCTVCQTRYRLDATKVPPRTIRVRCPDCSGVFVLDGTAAAEPAAPETLAEPVPAATTDIPDPLDGLQSGFGAVEPASTPMPAPAAAPEPAAPAAPAATLEPEPAPAPTPTPATEAAPASGGGPRLRRSKEAMLARALVSDILVYNREKRDAALAEGKLLEALGGEIKKSWELYKEKVTPDVANSTNHFRDALNEILAEGQKVF